jgi:hypothetical protein
MALLEHSTITIHKKENVVVLVFDFYVFFAQSVLSGRIIGRFICPSACIISATAR